eukprot:g9429.t1
MEDDDLAEMRRMRRSKHFESHTRAFGGSRAEANRLREEKANELQAVMVREREAEKEREATQQTEAEEEAAKEEALLRSMLPAGFGSTVRPVHNPAHGYALGVRKAKLTPAQSAEEGNHSDKKEKSAEQDEDWGKDEEEEEKQEEEEGKQEEEEEGGGEEDTAALLAAAAAGGGDFDEHNNPYRLPITHEGVLDGHKGAVSALATDKRGARLITGGYDYMLRFYEFNTMNRSLQAAREKEPHEGNQVRQVCYNTKSDKFLVVTGAATPKIFDREGLEMCVFKRGDGYLYDLHKTLGHVTGCTGGEWNPQNPGQLVTCSEDGTLRIWDVEQPNKNLHVIKLKGPNGKRAGVTACTYSRNGRWVAGAGVDGSIQVWDMRGKFLIPQKKCSEAHAKLTETSSLKFGPDHTTMLSRGGDGTVKVWDMRQMKAALKTLDDLPNEYPQLDVLYSPNDQLVVTGTASRSKGAQTGQLVFINATTWEPVSRVSMSEHAVTRLHWSHPINHIFVGCADGRTHALYSPTFSQKGMLLAMGKAAKRKSFIDHVNPLDIRNPHALPMYKDAASRKKQKILDRKKFAAPKPQLTTEPAVVVVTSRNSPQNPVHTILSDMICYAMLCYAMLCCDMLCYAMLCDAMLCYAMLCHAMIC